MQTDSKEEFIDFKKWFFLIAKKWYLFIIGIVLSLVITQLYKRYSINIYTIKSSVLLKGSSIGSNPLLGQNFYSSKLVQKNLVNEINIIKSLPTIMKVVRDLNLRVSYYVEGNIKTTELYPSAPIEVLFDTSQTNIPYNLFFKVKMLDNNSFHLAFRDNPDENVFPKPISLGSPITYNNFTFRIVRKVFDPITNDVFHFKINNLHEIAGYYRNAVNVAPLEKESSILIMSITSTNPTKEITFLNKLDSVYIVESMEDKNFTDNKTIEFIDDQLALINDTLNKIEGHMLGFRKQYNVIDLHKESDVVYTRIKEYERSKEQFVLDMKYFEYIKKYLEERSDYQDLIVPSSAGIKDPLLQTLITQLVNFQLKKNTEFKTTNPNSPFYKDNESKIQETKRNIYELITNIENSNKIYLDDLDRKIKGEKGSSISLLDTDRKYNNVKRIYDINSGIYSFLLQKKVEASINKAANAPEIKVVDEASIAGPVKPNHKNIQIYGLILGLIIPLLIVIGKELLNDNVRHKDDITGIVNIPFLGIIGHNPTEESIVITKKPKSAIAESFRSIRSNLQFFLNSPDKKIILITSAISGEGKTFSSINIASVIAISGKKTVLIGADMRKPKLFNEFGLKNDFGLSNYLVGRCTTNEIIQSTEIDNLSVITSGPIPPNPSELILSDRMVELLEKLKTTFDYIIIDSPPIGLVTDANILMNYTDTNIYVIRNNYSSKASIRYLGDLYTSGKISKITILMNDVRPKESYGYSYGYGYGGYGYGYGYGYYMEDKPQHQRRLGWLRKMLPSGIAKRD